MSDYFQAIVFRGDVNSSNLLIDHIRGSLASAGIIAANPSDCTLGDLSRSYGPGAKFQDTVSEADELLNSLKTNGVEFSVGRVVEIAPEDHESVCSSCDQRCEVDDQFYEVVSRWYEGNDQALFSCPNCGQSQPLTVWKIEPPCGFGTAVVKFWNWAPLRAEFLQWMGQLTSERFIFVQGKV